MHLLLSTIVLRPYVFVFLVSFLFIGLVNFGAGTTLLFGVLTYGLGLTCEYSSVHNGFPFGLYHYVETTRGHEIWVLGVPLFDSISYTFLAFASYTLALMLCSPLYRQRWDVRVLDTWRIRRSPRVLLMAALFMVMVDLVVDPLSVLGQRWFLGRIFWYDPPGSYFGVPISNFLGWYLVAAMSVAIFQVLDFQLNRSPRKPFGILHALPSRALLGPILYAGIVGFGITMLFIVHAPEIGWASLFIFLPFLAMALHTLTRPEGYRDADAIARHLADFPFNRKALAPPRIQVAAPTPPLLKDPRYASGRS
jgi:putative membrane protein